MTAPRTLAMVAAVGLAPLLVSALAAAPAQAHGAPGSPVSRAVACGPEARQNAQSAACRAAIAASGAQAFDNWDNVRVANVRGRDREMIPDGRLCSAGIDTYKGLDLARTDWPATRLSAGAAHTFTYRETIPHKGTFRVYVTRDGYDPSRPLRWSDIESKPFLTATDPARRNRAYVMDGKLPQAKTGRHVIYTIWQNSDTPDTYYSCSDVIFSAADGATDSAGGSSTTGSPAPTRSATPSATPSAPPADPPGQAPPPQVAAPSPVSSVLPLAGAGAAALAGLAVVGLVVAFLVRRRWS